jgi:hypothetical protein
MGWNPGLKSKNESSLPRKKPQFQYCSNGFLTQVNSYRPCSGGAGVWATHYPELPRPAIIAPGDDHGFQRRLSKSDFRG